MSSILRCIGVTAAVCGFGLAHGCVFYQDLDDAADRDGGPRPVDARETDAWVAPACAPSTNGQVTVEGQLAFIEDGAPLRASDAVGAVCTAATATGPCSLEVVAVDALELLRDPSSAVSLADIPVTDRGQLVETTFAAPALGYTALVARPRGGADHWVTSATVLATGRGSVQCGVVLPVVSKAVDNAWTASAGNPFGGDSFSDRGAMFVRYRDTAGPRAGVLFHTAGAPDARADFYFDGTSTSTAIDPALERTGPLGTALVVDALIVMQGGTGGEPSGCEWEPELSAAVRGVIVYTELFAVHPATAQPCP